ncbi:hypothetical protein OS493_015607 [Desmophyllum pertusum]|uniref:SUEL-type lectin domain-containing protein n=1 Tax=Desmophyllum pertusum TaxID=174260 RepID=A0A9X0CMP2_9CNID|nr:hypothetical protein OS493_015607 [Desmophyllum pertusum]
MTLCIFFTHAASFAKVCPTELATITCYNDSKIFIESVLYGRADNVTCLAPNQTIPSCKKSIDLSWRVTPYCQGLTYCVINGTYDVQEKPPCDGNNTNYFNIAYSCKTTSSLDVKSISSNTSSSLLNSSISSVPKQNNSVKYEFYNITQVLNPKRVHPIKLYNCRGKAKCSFPVTRQRFGDPYEEKITSLRLAIKHSCQRALNGYLQWEGWSACPDVCGVRYHQVRRRVCLNPTTRQGGGDCSAEKSETRTNGCYNACLERNASACDFMTANLSCPIGTFINIDKVFYGREHESDIICNSTGPTNGSCLPSSDMAGHNSAKVYQRCQMRRNCTVMVSNDRFLDPCPGFRKHLKIEYTCSPVFERTFCDRDNALISCPPGMLLVFHNKPFYGQKNSSESCPATSPQTCVSDFKYDQMTKYCKSNYMCEIPRVSNAAFNTKPSCPDTSNYLLFYHSCQKPNAIYTAWAPWRSCETCGLTVRRRRFRECIDPGFPISPVMLACNYWNKTHEQHCHYRCRENNVSLNDGENTTIICPMYDTRKISASPDTYHTVIEIRSVFYGNDSSCQSNNGSKIDVMKRCQGRNQCYLEASTDMFNDSCPGVKKYLNVTYRCQSIYKMSQSERHTLTPRDLRCYDDMVIVTHEVSWLTDNNCGNTNALKIIQDLCDGRNSCYVNHSKALLGGDGCSYPLTLKMYYSCQTAYGGLDTEWSPWSNCTECGHTPVKRRVKTCFSPVTQTSGAHCPLIQQIASCNYPCPVDGLSFINNDFSVVFGQNLSILWKMNMGTNSSVIIDWGDNSGNETLSQNIMANASTPFSLTNEHNYTSEGDYEVKLYGFNYFSNQTVSKMAYVQVKLSGLNFTANTALTTNTSSRFNISLDVISLSAPNVSFLFGDGSIFSSTSFETNYSYSQAGLFNTKAIASNKVSMLTSTRLQVIVQDSVEGFKVDRNVYLVAVGVNARFLFSIAQGTNVSVNASFEDCEVPFLSSWLSGPNHLDSLLTCVFDTVKTCTGLFYASNAVSQANSSALIISEVAIQGFNVTIKCQSRYPSCFQHDRILFHLNLTNGTRPKFTFNMGDGHMITSKNKTFDYSFAINGNFDINITAYNNVSSKSIIRKMKIIELAPMIGAHLTCNKTVGLSDLTVCNFGVQQGTAFQCWLDLGAKEQSNKFFVYFNLTSSISYNYTSYGAYTVKFLCNNTINSSRAEFITKVVPRTLEISISNNGPVMVTNVLTLTLSASDTGYPSCFALDLGNNHRVVFGSSNCTSHCEDGVCTVLPSFAYPSVQYNYTYSTAEVYNLTWSGQNDFNFMSVHTLVVITELPCLAPQVILQNIASNPFTPTGISRSKEVILRSRYQIDCQTATGATLQWKIFKNETDQGFVLQTTKTTVTSDLILLSNELEYGLYCIKLTLTLRDAYDITGTTEGYLKVTKSELIVDIQEGSANKRIYSEPVIINATDSVDPDALRKSGLEFKWYCYNITDRFADFSTSPTSKVPLSTLQDVLVETPLPDGCFNQNGTLPMNSSQITLPQQKTIKNGIYVIKLVLTAGNREATKATVIQMTDEEICNFHIRCKVNCKHLVITTDILSVRSLSGVCSKANSTSSFSWELFYRKVNETGQMKWTKVNDLENMTLSNTSSNNLVLKPNVLEPEMSYVMRLRHRSFAAGDAGLTEYSFTTSRPPYGGNCSVGPSVGKAYDTEFTFGCSGWQTEHLPLLYLFSYYDPYTELKPTIFRGEEEHFSVKLALGEPKDNDFHLKIFFSVIDSLGGRIDYQKLIKVLPRNFVKSDLEDLVLNDNSKLDFYLNIGDIDSVSELVSGVLSNLNYEATYPGNESSIHEMQDKVRYTVIEKISQIPISTLTDVNQVSTMMAAAAEAKEQVNSSAQQIATDKISSMITLLVNKSQEDVGVSVVREGAVNLVSAVFNILMAASYNADFRRKDITKDVDQKRCVSLFMKLILPWIPNKSDGDFRRKF